MKIWILLLLLLVATVAEVRASESRVLAASVDKVWLASESLLKQLGWSIDRADRTIGWITTESRWLEGEQYGVYAKGTRHRLRVNVRTQADGRTAVTVERNVFKRERILWIDTDESVPTPSDGGVEKEFLTALEKSL